jgi:branched-chain amino acid transport system permease protein
MSRLAGLRLFIGPKNERLLLLAVLLFGIPFTFPNTFFFDIAVKVFISGIVCIGLNTLSGYAGQISLGHAGLFALGGYGTAILNIRLGIHPFASAFITAALVGAGTYFIAKPILRLRGHYLAMATLGLGMIISIVLNREIGLTGGPDGLTVPAVQIGHIRLRSIEFWYWVAAVFLLISVWFAENLFHSPAGRALRAIHSSELAAETSGVDVSSLKTLAFTFSALLASIAGSLFVMAERFITPADAGFGRSVDYLTMIVFGGLGSTYGALVGAAVLTSLPQIIAPLAEYTNIVTGMVLILTMIFMPKGLGPSLYKNIRNTDER